MKSPYDIIKRRYITEKSTVLEQLQHNTSNKCVAKCKSPKYVFLVDIEASKQEIAEAVAFIYKEQNVKVVSVNTITTKGKVKRKGRGKPGKTSSFKKAIVTLEPGDLLER